jgi:flagellar biosynthesis/type III secretory pathway chaperone
MFHPSSIEAQAEPLLNLLIAQCRDLEELLTLARRETAAVEKSNFEELMQVVKARASMEQKLEVHQRQIAEMRQRLDESSDAQAGGVVQSVMEGAVALRAQELVSGILMQDEHTRPMLTAVRSNLAEEIRVLNQKRRRINAYLREAEKHSLACDQLA